MKKEIYKKEASNKQYSFRMIFTLAMMSYFFTIAPILVSNYYGLAIIFQLLIFTKMFEMVRNKISFAVILRFRFLSLPIACIFLILLQNILLISWFSSKNQVVGFLIVDEALVLLHITLFTVCLAKLITMQVFSRNLTAIYGAGIAGQQLHQELNIQGDYKVLFFVDDDAPQGDVKVEGLYVLSRQEFTEIFYKVVDYVFVAIPTITDKQLNSLIISLEGLNLQVKKLPPLKDIPMGKASFELMSLIDEADLIGRRTVIPDVKLLKKNISNKVVLVTGAGGSIGSAICVEIIKHSPREIILFDVSEFGLYKINSILEDIIKKDQKIKISIEIGSIQSLKKIKGLYANYNIDTVFHAAAYKHVPLVELNLLEAFHNNVLGTKNLISETVRSGVKNFVLISSDKAVRPTNFMGVTKRLCELICHSYSSKNDGTVISMVRFGNVLGSSGSVVPLFKDQINAGGPVTVTHPDITRYFMTVEEAAELVIQASGLADGGEIFVLDMGEPIKILDLAKRMISLSGKDPVVDGGNQSINSIHIEFTGLRPGEKMHEELSLESNSESTSHPQIDKCDKNFFEDDVLDVVLERLQKALEENQNRYLIKEIVNELPVSYEPSN